MPAHIFWPPDEPFHPFPASRFALVRCRSGDRRRGFRASNTSNNYHNPPRGTIRSAEFSEPRDEPQSSRILRCSLSITLERPRPNRRSALLRSEISLAFSKFRSLGVSPIARDFDWLRNFRGLSSGRIRPNIIFPRLTKNTIFFYRGYNIIYLHSCKNFFGVSKFNFFPIYTVFFFFHFTRTKISNYL